MPSENKPQIQSSKTFQLNTLIDYNTDAIVSRTLYQNNAGTITLFAFDRGQSLSEHTAPFDALVQVLDGTAEIIIDGIPYSMNAGDIILMPANVPHAVKAAERFKMLLTMVKT